MERNCLRSGFRYQRVNTTAIVEGGGRGGGGPNTPTVKGQRNKLCRAAEEDFMNGISWPPRSYTCNFCKREFRSAQALGGHMNVHRRDRALLYSPPPDGQFTNLNLNLQHNPNPNPNSNLSSPCSTFETNKWVAAVGGDDGSFGRPFDWKASDLKTSTAEIAKPNVFERDHWNKGEKFIGLDIEISTNKKDIDLELRLGYSA